MKTLFARLLLAVSAAFANVQAAQTAFFYNSSPESIVALGKSDVNVPGQDCFFGGIAVRDATWIKFDIVGLSRWSFAFQAPYGETLEVGTKYLVTNWAVDYGLEIGYPEDVRDRPVGMFAVREFGFPEFLSASFTILELEYGVGENAELISSFAVNFQQFESAEASGEAWVYGSLRYNSDIPLSGGGGEIPEPSTYAGIAGAVMLGFAFWIRRKRF